MRTVFFQGCENRHTGTEHWGGLLQREIHGNLGNEPCIHCDFLKYKICWIARSHLMFLAKNRKGVDVNTCLWPSTVWKPSVVIRNPSVFENSTRCFGWSKYAVVLLYSFQIFLMIAICVWKFKHSWPVHPKNILSEGSKWWMKLFDSEKFGLSRESQSIQIGLKFPSITL